MAAIPPRREAWIGAVGCEGREPFEEEPFLEVGAATGAGFGSEEPRMNLPEELVGEQHAQPLRRSTTAETTMVRCRAQDGRGV